MIGKTISHYRILEKLGEGGMGVVYKAEDENLHRPVALKFLRADTTEDRQAHGRFWKEAEAAAALDHPHITTVYEIAEAEGHTFIALALIEGESLATKIKQRPLPLDEALRIAGQVGEALQAAHQRGIVHRDIKPSNIMITPDGRVKVMDFGLAHLAGQTRITKTGTIMGTPAYMSPEQAQGQTIDRRSDIWSLGVVLYEMVTGRLPFKGENDQSVLYAILHNQHEPMTAIRVGTPPELDRIVAKMLSKDPDERYQHADELKPDIRGIRSSKGTAGIQHARSASGHAAQTTIRQRYLPWITASILGLIALTIAVVHFTEASPEFRELRLRRFSFTPDSLSMRSSLASGGRAAISPDARHIAYVSGEQPPRLWLRSLSGERARPLSGTNGISSKPIWSPDSEWIAFGAGSELKKIFIDGGAPITLCSSPDNRFPSGAWSPGGETIIVPGGFTGGLDEVSAMGGLLKPVFDETVSELGPLNGSPSFLPREAPKRALLIDVGTATKLGLYLLELDTGKMVKLADGSHGIYSPTGHVIYEAHTSGSGLWALPFSLEKLAASGEAFPIAAGLSDPSVANDGTLVAVDLTSTAGQRLTLRDRQGLKVREIGSAQHQVWRPAISPDGTRVAVEGVADRADAGDIWVYDVDRDLNQRLTFDDTRDTFPLWSPDGEWIAFRSDRGGQRDLWAMPADGSQEPLPLTQTEAQEYSATWAPDGRRLLFAVRATGGGQDLWLLTLDETRTPVEATPFLETPFNTGGPEISPNGGHVAYVSDESGRTEVYVRRFPEGTGQTRVSGNGGVTPRWSRDGTELFYIEGDTLVGATIDTQTDLKVGLTKRLFKSRSDLGWREFDVSADGHFLFPENIEADGGASQPAIRIVQNWFAEFRDRL